MQHNLPFKSYIPPKQPELNGGLYTGEPFRGNWGNIPVIPDEVFLTHKNLISANPPPNATTQFGNNIRPGNNQLILPSAHNISQQHNILCTNKKPIQDSVKSFNPNESPYLSYTL